MIVNKSYFLLKSLFIIAFFIFVSCGVSTKNTSKYNFVESPPFTLSQVYYQDWIGGIEKAGSGTHFYFSTAKENKSVLFKNVYFRKKIAPVMLVSEKQSTHFIAHFTNKKNDVIMSDNPLEEAKNKPPLKFIFKLSDDEAVLSYTYKGKLYYVNITDLHQKHELIYPATHQ